MRDKKCCLKHDFKCASKKIFLKWTALNKYGFRFPPRKKAMESIKCAIHESIQSTHGECTLNLIDKDLCISICVHKYPDYVIYIRPDDRQTHFLCHYAHRGDLEACADVSAEMEEWKQQAILQMPRKVEGKLGLFSSVALNYVRDALQRIETMKGVSGRGFYKKIKTFAEAKQELLLNPKPRRAAKVLPPPVCHRHNDVHNEASKRKKIKERVAQNKTKEEVYVWKAAPATDWP